MRKFLSQIFWSHGTSLGSLGPLSQGDVHPGFFQPQFLVIWGPYNNPGTVACLEKAENLKLTYSLVWCVRPCCFIFGWLHLSGEFGFWLSQENGAQQSQEYVGGWNLVQRHIFSMCEGLAVLFLDSAMYSGGSLFWGWNRKIGPEKQEPCRKLNLDPVRPGWFILV